MRYTIGDLARRTGLSVKTIRFYSDAGIVPPTGRTAAGYRLYGPGAAARLDLVRTLRDLGLDLATIRKVVDRELPLREVAAAHAEALDAQVRALRLRRAVLRVVARRGSSPEEMDTMHKLARLSEDERRRLVADFLDHALSQPELACIRPSLTPELPEDPTDEQVEAWVELAGLTRDPDFRAAVHRMGDLHLAGHSYGAAPPYRDLVAVVREHVRPALAAGIDPDAPEAAGVVAAVRAGHGRVDPDLLAAAADPRWARYLRLLATVNGWPPPENQRPVIGWLLRALGA
ncbi:MerR family transcriptional regulator [Nonomuraea typhae]|uniref:MerR family transcriptional regulator n=1 Tax=Nonomuraea typhae TaxID=2603600 RepID=A0ABW7Z3I8_9ACTN